MVIRVASLNVDSIVSFNRRRELNNILVNFNIDILMVQETKLDEKITFKIDGYNTLRNDNIRGKGGTAILVRDSFHIKNHTVFNNIFHANSIDIFINNQWINFSSAYFPPGRRVDINLFDSFFQVHSLSFMGGDFNGRNRSFGDVSDNVYGTHLIETINKLRGYILNPPSPTCFHDVHGSYIDKFINLTRIIPNANIRLLPSFSDHAAIMIEIPITTNIERPISMIYDFKNANMEKFNKYIELNTKRLVIPLRENIDSARADQLVENYNEIISTAIDKFVPISKTHTSSRVILSPATRKLQAVCKNLQRKLYRNDGLQFSIKRKLIGNIRNLKIMIRNSCNTDTAKFFTDLYSGVESTHDAFKTIKNFTGHRKRVPMGGAIYADVGKNTTICGTDNIAYALGNQFAANNKLSSEMHSEFQTTVDNDVRLLNSINTNLRFNNEIGPLIHDKDCLTLINNKLPSHQQNLLTSVEEVEKIIENRPNKKSTGSDSLPFTIIKQFSAINIIFLTILFNHCLAISHFPKPWKMALVIGIPKPGKDSSIIINWRPISQLCCVSKIFEKIISIRLNHVIHKLGVFENQFGFLKQHSTTHALAKIQDKINHGLNGGMITSIVAVDLRSAFDVVWHDGLIHKMIKLGFDPGITKIIQNFLKNRQFSVRLNGHTSKKFDMDEGMPQGSVISPQLFNIYIHDIPIDKNIQITQFADDITLHYTHKNPKRAQDIFNKYLTVILDYLKTWKLLLSSGKTEFINILGRVTDTNPKIRKLAYNMKLSINGQILPISGDIRLLGVQFQTNNTFTKNVKIRLQRAVRARANIRRILTNRHISTKIKTSIYKIYIRSILTYGSPVWCQPPLISSHQMELMRMFERSCLRQTAGIRRNIGSFKHINMSEIYDKSQCIRIDKFIAQLHINFYGKCRNSRKPKFKFTIYGGSNRKYKPIYYLHKLHVKNRLIVNDKLLVFHQRYNNQPGLVYNTNQ